MGAVLVTLALGTAVAHAEPPAVTLTTPSPGTVIVESSTTFAGSTNDPFDSVTVDVYQGSGKGVTPVREESATPSGGAWSVQAVPPLPDGTYTAVAQQGTVEVGSSAEVTFTVDTTPPTLTLNPISSVIATATPSFGGTGGQEAGDGPVHVFLDGSPAGEAAVSAESWTLTSAHLSDGIHTVRAEQSDEAGNTSKTGTASFRVDTTAPAPTVTGPKAGEMLKSSLVEFHGGAGSATGDGAEVTVEVFKGESTAAENLEQSFTVTRSGSSWSSQRSLSDGTHTVRVKQSDSVGNTGASAAVSFAIDTVAPTLTLNPIPSVIATATPSFGGTGGQEAGDGPVHVFVDGNPAGEAAVSGGNWTLASSHLGDGTHTVRAEQSDQAGNVSKTGTVSFRVDTTAPAPTITGPKAGEKLKTSLVEFHGGAGNATGDGAEVTVEVFKGESTAVEDLDQSFTVARSGSSWSSAGKGPSLSDGTYTVRVTQSDSVGNTGASAAVTFAVDTTPPALTLNAIPPVIASATLSFGGTGGQEAGDGPVHVFVDGSPAGEATVSGGSWTLASAPLKDGTHTVRAEQSDEAGNTSKTGTASFRVDTTAPAPTVTGPKAGEILKSSLVDFHGGAGNATGDGAEVTVEVFQGESTAAENFEQSFTVTRSGSGWSSAGKGPRLSNGEYTVRVKQSDSVGHTGASPPVSFEVASPAPSVTLDELPRFIDYTTPSFRGVADTSSDAKPEVTMRIWRGTSASGSMVESTSGATSGATWSLGPVGALADGTYTAQAEQPALANPAGVSETTTFTVDTQAPHPTLSAPGESTGLETVSGVAGTATGDRRQVTAELFAGGTTEGGPIETITVIDNATTGTWTATFAGLAAGQYTVIAQQSDEAGNAGSSAPQMFTVSAPPAALAPAAPTPPVASFTWLPATPTVGQTVSFVSKSTDVSSPITAFGWDMAGSGPFAAGGPLSTATFATAGAHTVRLQVSDALGQSSSVAETVQVAPRTLTLMQPFPIVRIAGAETAGGARIRLLSVQAPPTAKVAVTCKGRGCKTKTESRVVTASSKRKSGAITLAFPRFQRALGAGAVLQIRITKSGEIGKFTSFTIRRKKLPVRVDACLRPTSTSPSSCPSQ
ncbi:MAG: Ig-like domain-containing protein [Solirubrobacterales bacterium]